MPTEVFQAYGTDFNVSLTLTDGVIVSHTRWVTGESKSTTRITKADSTVFNLGSPPKSRRTKRLVTSTPRTRARARVQARKAS